ncbi:hypothetical protein EUTSA_v10008310mg [Eutrema salsugineum]|uniref:2-oxoglutarate-dependent dioxygenase DAO n=1 Tax=Eutrema salsugineum TaxID=72664 RepID=V4KZD7_EUTSA|nr:2-oxoglutarate-dependent dioxygenase DAO [Eutrema salsugineum]ESQ35407.1 hypothetical protein EUTSA_v10008310mg [Eutrema salsugineum]
MADLKEVIPTIDLQEIPDKMLNQKIREASERWGCFKVINHGVSMSLMAEMKKTVTDLHELPNEVKMRNTDVILNSGYKPIIELNPLYESFGLYDIASPKAVNTFCDQIEASSDQREILVKYGKAMDGLAKDLVRRLGESYELEKTDFCKGWPIQSRISKYHFKPETIGRSGLIVHTDPGFLTILQGDEDCGGLEALDTCSGTYFPINTLPNTLTVNLGDMARIWSNGRLCNVKHRVQCKKAARRITISSFLLTPTDLDVEPPSEFVDAQHPRLYKPISDGELRKIRMSHSMHDGESLKYITI